MNSECVICGKKLGENRFSHLMSHLTEGTAVAKLDVKNEYWYFRPNLKAMQKYKGWKIKVEEPKKEGGEEHALRTPETEEREDRGLQEGLR
jgi:hypothetical protein